MKPLTMAIVVALIVGFAALFYFNIKTEEASLDAAGRGPCPDHWHNGFDVYYEQDGALKRVNFAAPRWPGTSLAYYEWSNGPGRSAPGMTLATHMHNSGTSPEQPNQNNQLHYEKSGTCVGVADALGAVDIDITATSLTLTGGHRLGLSDLVLTANATDTLRIWTMDLEGTWTERAFNDIAHTQVKDGESFLVAFGSFTPEQVKTMQEGVHDAASREFRLAKLRENGGATGTSTSP